MKKLYIGCVLILGGIWYGFYALGKMLLRRSYPRKPYPALSSRFKTVKFQSTSGETLEGWYYQLPKPKGIVVLMHGVRSSRADMLSRSTLFLDMGYSVFLFDFQGHGKSSGNRITFGYKESQDVESAFAFLEKESPNLPIGVLGFSLGGAAFLLSSVVQKAHFVILEAVYTNITQAITNRLVLRFGFLGKIVYPLFTLQMKYRIGVSARWLSPIDHIGKIRAPLLIIGGTEDRRTTIEETKSLYAKAQYPKELWIVPEAQHQNLYSFDRRLYESNVKTFLSSIS